MKLETSTLEQIVHVAMERNGLTDKTPRLIVAISGGPNSVSLLHCLWKLSHQIRLSLHAAHLNHMLRGNEADLDAEFVINLCRTLGIPYTIGKMDVGKFGKKLKVSSIEEAARQSRYAFLSNVAKKFNYPIIATGHTADDQTETILMHILRGSGLTGLSGMKEYTNDFPSGLSVFRPILRIRNEKTLSYCEENHLSYRIDSTNKSNKFTRNKIRNKLIPSLSQFNPQLHNAVNQLGEIAAESINYLESVAQDILNRISSSGQSSITLPVGKVLSTHVAVRHLILQLAIRQLTGNNQFVPRDKILKIEHLLLTNSNSSFQLSKSIIVSLNTNALTICQMDQATNNPNSIQQATHIEIPGEYWLTTGTLAARIDSSPSAIKDSNSQLAYFDKETIGSNLALRYWRTGDRFQPLGMKHTKKLQNFFVDMKIPQHLRAEIPLLTSEKGILWVVGYRTSAVGKVIPSSKTIIKMEWFPNDTNSSIKLQ